MTATDPDDWPPVAVPGAVDPACLPDTVPAPWTRRPQHHWLADRPTGTSNVISLADWRRR